MVQEVIAGREEGEEVILLNIECDKCGQRDKLESAHDMKSQYHGAGWADWEARNASEVLQWHLCPTCDANFKHSISWTEVKK